MRKLKGAKAPVILVCLVLVSGGCSTNAPPAPILDPDDLRKSCIEQQEYRREYFPDGCYNPWGVPGYERNKQCYLSESRGSFACGQYVHQKSKEKEESKTWACAEGHSCR